MLELPETTVDLLNGYSLEITAKEESKLEAVAPLIPAGSVVSITFLPSETADARIAAAVRLRRLGLTPMPHIAARRLSSADELQRLLGRLSNEAGVDRVFVVAGDCDRPEGPFDDSMAVIRNGRLEDHGIRLVGIGGYPDGHPAIPQDKLWRALADKMAQLAERGMDCEIVTQFGFDADPMLSWIQRLRASGVWTPVRIGLPGPASVATLLRFARHCGVGSSTRVLSKYGVSLTRALAPAGPDRLVDALAKGLTPALHGTVRAHLYPFGGLMKAVEWATAYGRSPR